MIRSRYVIALAMLALVSPAVSAFEETKATIAPDRQQSASPGHRADAKTPLDLNGTGTSVDASTPPSTGTEVRIPGLGKLGVFPKLDFGLELLYGGREDRATEPDRGRAENDDVQIRGSIKHRF